MSTILYKKLGLLLWSRLNNMLKIKFKNKCADERIKDIRAFTFAVWPVFGRPLVRARSACNIPSSGCTYIPPQHDRCCRRRHQRHGRIQERSGLEMYTVPCATSSLLPRRRATSSRRVDFGRCSPSATSTTPLTSHFPNPRGPLVSVSSRSGCIRKLLPKLRVCVFRLVTVVRI
jgi:hypothetical protein